jgi:hypothetical protein
MENLGEAALESSTRGLIGFVSSLEAIALRKNAQVEVLFTG